MGDNNKYTPLPVESTVEAEFRYYEALPKKLRQAAIECRYEYSGQQLTEMLQYYKVQFWNDFSGREALSACLKELEKNDQVLTQQEMEKKWNSTLTSSNISLNAPTRPIVHTARRLATIRNYRGPTPQTGRKPLPAMEYDLYGPETPVLRTPTIRG